jgi:hypothetical protein
MPAWELQERPRASDLGGQLVTASLKCEADSVGAVAAAARSSPIVDLGT